MVVKSFHLWEIHHYMKINIWEPCDEKSRFVRESAFFDERVSAYGAHLYKNK